MALDFGFADTGDAGQVDTGLFADAAEDSAVDATPDAGPEAGPDATPDSGSDTGVTDVGSTDRPIPDLGTTPDAADSGPRDALIPDATAIPAECMQVIDLATEGTRTGSTTRYVGENRTAPIAAGIPGPTECRRMALVGAERAFRYTPANTSALRVSTNYALTNFDTIAWALDRCVQSGAMELGCNDDALVPPRRSASTFVTSERVAGQPLYIIVAGYLIMTSSVAQGDFDLRITELSRLGPGRLCDPSGETSYCAPGTICTRSSTRAGTPTTCVLDGTFNGRCRSISPACNTGLGCNAAMRCVRTVPAGALCDPARLLNVCAPPSACVTSGGMSTCVQQEYAETALPNPTFIDACATGMHVMLTDRDDGHSTAAITLPFTFRLFGTSFTEVWPDTNGFVAFGPTAPDDAPSASIPTSRILAAVAPFYEDLVLRDAPGSDICVLTTGTAPNRRFVVEWLDAYAYMHSSVHATFEVILSETTSSADFIYSRLGPSTGADAPFADGSHASVGLQNTDASHFQRHSGNVSIANGIRLTPN